MWRHSLRLANNAAMAVHWNLIGISNCSVLVGYLSDVSSGIVELAIMLCKICGKQVCAWSDCLVERKQTKGKEATTSTGRHEKACAHNSVRVDVSKTAYFN